MQDRKKVAIVGSGCSGIAALWALKSTSHEVHLYEANTRLGGHTNTVDFQHENETTKVDTGFIVMNSVTYPNFLAFLKNIGIKPVPTDMTFAVSRDCGAMEWGGVTLSSLFAQRSNILKLSMWRMLFDIVRFNQFALDLLAQSSESEVDSSGANGHLNGIDYEKPREGQISIGEYLDREGYSEAFRNDYLIPMTAAVWSTAPDKASLEFPATTLVRFMWNHHLLTTVSARPTWMTILGGTKPYIDTVLKDFPKDRVHLGVKVERVMVQPSGKVILQTSDRDVEYDHIILATHGDQALDIVRYTATPQEQKILSGFRTSTNTAVLHSDLSVSQSFPNQLFHLSQKP